MELHLSKYKIPGQYCFITIFEELDYREVWLDFYFLRIYICYTQ